LPDGRQEAGHRDGSETGQAPPFSCGTVIAAVVTVAAAVSGQAPPHRPQPDVGQDALLVATHCVLLAACDFTRVAASLVALEPIAISVARVSTQDMRIMCYLLNGKPE
jgi:hypothetical protein